MEDEYALSDRPWNHPLSAVLTSWSPPHARTRAGTRAGTRCSGHIGEYGLPLRVYAISIFYDFSANAANNIDTPHSVQRRLASHVSTPGSMRAIPSWLSAASSSITVGTV